MTNPSKPVAAMPVALPVIRESVAKQMTPSGCQGVHEQRYKAEIERAQCSKRIWCYEKYIFFVPQVKWWPHIMHIPGIYKKTLAIVWDYASNFSLQRLWVYQFS